MAVVLTCIFKKDEEIENYKTFEVGTVRKEDEDPILRGTTYLSWNDSHLYNRIIEMSGTN